MREDPESRSPFPFRPALFLFFSSGLPPFFPQYCFPSQEKFQLSFPKIQTEKSPEPPQSEAPLEFPLKTACYLDMEGDEDYCRKQKQNDQERNYYNRVSTSS